MNELIIEQHIYSKERRKKLSKLYFNIDFIKWNEKKKKPWSSLFIL